MFYEKYKTEIWGGLSIIVAIAIGIIPMLLDNNPDKKGLNFVPYTIYICCLAIITMILILIKNKSLKSLKAEGLFPSKFETTYKDIISNAHTKYWYYGMSGEILQKEMELIPFLSVSNDLSEIKLILLHPDCKSFRERISAYNGSIDARISRKRNQILSLLATISALPEDKRNKIEIRFTQTYPVWILQFINTKTKTKETEDVNQMYLKVQLTNKHSKFSKLYEASINTDIFNSFKNYFTREWESATQISDYSKIPNLIDSFKDKE